MIIKILLASIIFFLKKFNLIVDLWTISKKNLTSYYSLVCSIFGFDFDKIIFCCWLWLLSISIFSLVQIVKLISFGESESEREREKSGLGNQHLVCCKWKLNKQTKNDFDSIDRWTWWCFCYGKIQMLFGYKKKIEFNFAVADIGRFLFSLSNTKKIVSMLMAVFSAKIEKSFDLVWIYMEHCYYPHVHCIDRQLVRCALTYQIKWFVFSLSMSFRSFGLSMEK